MNKRNENMVNVEVELSKADGFYKIEHFKKLKSDDKLDINENFIGVMSSKDSIINVTRENNDNCKHLMTVSGASFDIVKGIEDKIYLEMTNDEWGRFCFITKEPSLLIIRTDLLFLDIKEIIKGTDYSALILGNEPISYWRVLIDQTLTNAGISVSEISDNGIEASSKVSVYNIFHKDNNKISKVVFYTDSSNAIINGEEYRLDETIMKTKDIFKKTDWSRLFENESEEMKKYIPECKGVIKEDDKHISLLFYLNDPKESLEGYGSWELFEGLEFNKMNHWAQGAILRDAFTEMFSCQTIFGWDNVKVCGFNENSYVVHSVTRYSTFCEMFDEKHIRINAAGLVSSSPDIKSNNDNLFVVTIAIIEDNVKVYTESN